jgi:hypothetical protein
MRAHVQRTREVVWARAAKSVHFTTMLALCGALAGCKAEHAHVTGATSGTAGVVGTSWDLCPWVGPSAQRPGIFGTDLGFTVSLPSASDAPDQLALLFGDTWASAADACNYPVLKSDDLAARIPAQRPASLTPGQPMAATTDACSSLQYTLNDASDNTSWRRIRVFPDASSHADDQVLDTSMLRTPLTAWSDGTHTFSIFIRDQFKRCAVNSDCPTAMACTQDPSYQGKHIGGCQPQISLSSDAPPSFCRDDSDCSSPTLCTDLDQGLCVATEPFKVQRDGQNLNPSWYADDPRNGEASILYVASAFWPERPEDYATGFQFVTNKFTNVTARTVKHFDPQQPENSDYTPGNETLLVWGRAAFKGLDGFQALPFLLYQPLNGLIDDSTGAIAWAPKYFAGYDDTGDPSWSNVEADAQPLYGVDENLVQQSGQWTWNWQSPEFDYVNQMTTTWAAPLKQWVMIYGGETPATSDPSDGKRPPPTYPQSVPGAVYMRSAPHPFGRAHASDALAQSFGAARPLLAPTTMKDQLACDSDIKSSDRCTADLNGQPGNLLSTLAGFAASLSPGDFISASAKCVAGTAALGAQYSVGDDSAGHLYGSAIIEPWTQDVTGALPDAAKDDPAVEIYWNVSTWNPYQVRLVKTQLRASQLGTPQ